MSLLLDALKKAAEQKAAKSKQEEVPEATSSDQTEIAVAPGDISEFESRADSDLQTRRELQDETELDMRQERTLVDHDDVAETQFEAADSTQTETLPVNSQASTGEDETLVFAEEDVADFMGEPELVNRGEDDTEYTEISTGYETGETDISEITQSSEDTEYTEVMPDAAVDEIDETDITQLTQGGDDFEYTEVMAGGATDEADITQLTQGSDDTEYTEMLPGEEADQTDISRLVPGQDDTDISQPPLAGQPVEAGQATVSEDANLQQFAAASDDTDSSDEDISLLLVERDQTNLTNPTAVTDPRIPKGMPQDSGADDDLALVDTTRHQIPAEVTSGVADTQTRDTLASGNAYDTQTGITSPTGATSTRTYAPDNYDRTLMRLPSDDASKLFAGMKSDSDVVMTPEYAKKVFHSKSSAQRIQHYKFYGGIAAIILLGIAVYGLFEYQDQTDSIDTSLRPLMRDPMPGIIRPAAEPGLGGLMVDVENKARTIDLLEKAENSEGSLTGTEVGEVGEAVEAGEVGEVGEPEAAPEVVAENVSESAAQAGVVSGSEAAATTETEVAMIVEQASATESSSQSQLESSVTTGGASTVAADSAAPESGSSSSTLEISTSQRVEQKSIWLREAYAAYQAGNDELALSLYNKVLETDPGNRNALLARAAIKVQHNDSRGAIRDYQALLLANPKDSLAMASLIAIANYSPQETETQLKLMIRDEPDSPYLNFALANAYGAQSRWLEAQGHYFKALENNPGDPNYAYNLAVSLEHISQPQAAVAYYRRALQNIGNGLATFSKEVVDQRLETLGNP